MMGRPPIFKDPEELQKKVDEYFEYVKGEINPDRSERKEHETVDQFQERLDQPGWIREPEKITITGLCLYLGFCSRDSFYQYGDKKEFMYTIKKAHMRIQQHYENLIQDNNVAGPIFALKNLGWKDQTQTDVNLKGDLKFTGIEIQAPSNS